MKTKAVSQLDTNTTEYILRSMKTSVISVKVDETTKRRAQAVASSFGIPLSTLVNAYLVELAETRQVHFSAVEVITPHLEKLIAEAEAEIKAGKTAGPFETTEEFVASLKNLSGE